MKHSLLLAIVLLFFVSPAMGLCDVPQPRLVCAEYFASKVVVEASVVKVKSIHDKAEPQGVDAYDYSLRANQVIRGHIDPIFVVHEGNDSGRATFDWKTGREYLLFLFYSDSDKAWELDGCGNSGPVSDAKIVLQQIAAIHTSHDGGVIHGVISQPALSAPISDVRVEARGAKGHYTATANSRGEFEIKVPVGRYAVRATKAGFSFATADFSYENPNKVQIESGGCAQVQLVSVGETSQPPR
jgi:Carboxypeptidase regulatory-like domain